MDYKQNDLYRMGNGNSQKVPFYMTYPMQNVFLEEAEYEKDFDRLKGMYPKEVQKIRDLVEEECDKMEYEGSMMFDEYPDRLMLRQTCRRIYDRAMQDQDFEDEQYETMEAEELRMVGPGRPPHGPGFPPPPPPHFGPPPRPGFGPPPPPPPPGFGPPPPPPGRPNRPDFGLNNLIEVLLFNEMYQRRCRHKRCRLWW